MPILLSEATQKKYSSDKMLPTVRIEPGTSMSLIQNRVSCLIKLNRHNPYCQSKLDSTSNSSSQLVKFNIKDRYLFYSLFYTYDKDFFAIM